jgi:hypothetical protein
MADNHCGSQTTLRSRKVAPLALLIAAAAFRRLFVAAKIPS